MNVSRIRRLRRSSEGGAAALAILLALLCVPCSPAAAAPGETPAEATLAVPALGASSMRLLTPTVLEITRVGTPDAWDFTQGPPRADRFTVDAGRGRIRVEAVGFRRRARFAPERRTDLRVECALYLRLATPVAAGARVRVASSLGTWTAAAAPLRWSPAIHVNHEGYAARGPKVAVVGAWLGTLGELPIEAERFTLVDAQGRVVMRGPLRPRPDGGTGAPSSLPRQTREADFSRWTTPGRYRVAVDGLGVSFPFAIDDAVPACIARTYALGLYHQRCGAPNVLPFTRFTRRACHLAPAQVPTAANVQTQRVLAELGRVRDPQQTARPLGSLAQALYPFVRRGTVDVHGGHHDAGDYSKYLIDSALLAHTLLFATDHIPGAARLDNLGLPESGDGCGDLLQLARWELAFIGRAQDRDGGFCFLVYPRDRKYEWDVMPDAGDPQVLFPKNTSATAACVAALAQAAASPAFRARFPREAARCLVQARAGFAFLERAWKVHGKRGAYQRVTHYGAEFGDRDEIAWAEAEMLLATGERRYEALLRADFDPGDPRNLRWTWWRLFEGYGCLMRDVAFRGAARGLDPALVEACRQQVLEAGREQARWTEASAYRTSYPLIDKRYGNAAWYAGGDRAFDAMAAFLLEPSPGLLDTVVGNIDFDCGMNPSNVSFVTGLGWRRPRIIVSQEAENDRQQLPPSGLAMGSLRAVEPYLGRYRMLLRTLSFPRDDVPLGYPLYNRWCDTWHVQTELVTATQARCLASAVFLMAPTPLAAQPWRGAPAHIRLPGRIAAGQRVVAQLSCDGLDLRKACRIVWERNDAEPCFGGTTLSFTPAPGRSWVEAEAQWLDGRRVFAVVDFEAR